MNLFWELHKDIPREGPGEDEATLRAYALLQDLPKQPRILDIGCGPGAQTIALAKATDGQIVAVDAHEPFLDELVVRAQREGVGERVTAQKGNMFALEFENESFDLIWSEGAIYIIGFQRGLIEWREYLKAGGYLVVSELSWLRDDLPAEVKEFWMADYPGMQSIAGNLQIIEEAGYELIGHFTLPESGWWKDYYNPLTERVQMLREKYADNEEAHMIFGLTEKEIEMYREFSAYYGYEFYIMRKPI